MRKIFCSTKRRKIGKSSLTVTYSNLKVSVKSNRKGNLKSLTLFTWALACSPTKITSLVASCNGISEINRPLPVSPSKPSMKGEPINRRESDSGQCTICPLSSRFWKKDQAVKSNLLSWDTSNWKCFVRDNLPLGVYSLQFAKLNCSV